MPKKSLNPLTEPMYYVLLCLAQKNMSGTEISEYVRGLTSDRVRLGPGTLYAILSTFQEEKIIERMKPEGRRIPYQITAKGRELFQEEVNRLRRCLADAERDYRPGEETGSEPAAKAGVTAAKPAFA